MAKQKRGNKKAMSSWIWILIVLIILAVGIGAYFLLTSGNGGVIPQPPALPN